MNSSFSLHKIDDESQYPFDPNEYSWFKFGDKQYAEKFASELFEGFIVKYGDLLVAKKEIVILPSPYLSIPTASNFLCYYFKKRLNSFLFKNNIINPGGKSSLYLLFFLKKLINFALVGTTFSFRSSAMPSTWIINSWCNSSSSFVLAQNFVKNNFRS